MTQPQQIRKRLIQPLKDTKVLKAVTALIIVLTVLILEKFAAGALIFDTVKGNAGVNELANLIYDHGKAVSRTLTLSICIYLVLRFRQLNALRQLLLQSNPTYRISFLLAQGVLFFVFCWVTPQIFQGTTSGTLIIVWMALALSLVPLTGISFASGAFWRHFFCYEFKFFALAILISSGVWLLGSFTQNLWDSMSSATFSVVASGLKLFNSAVIVDISGQQKIIGVNSFLVNVAPACSGYEGIGLITAFTAVYLYSFRADFRFPMAFILFPIAAIIIWLFNAARIIALISIGAYWSADVAVWGFHTQAGWITFIMCSVLVMVLTHKIPWFRSTTHSTKPATKKSSLPISTLLPLIVLLTATIATSAFSGQFDWLYPLRVITCGAVILYLWQELALTPIKITYRSVVIGALVTILWVLLVPNAPDADALFSDTLTKASEPWNIIWLVFRFVGAVITVPIAEELGFRAYLICRVSSQPVSTQGNLPFSVLGFAVSSLAFGLLHGAWIAGTVAGAAYALVRYKSQHVTDAIAAHSVTNALLFIYAYQTGYWSIL